MSEKSTYERLAAIDVSGKLEKKGNLSYLSWAWAVDQLLRADPAATWEYRHFGDLPYLTLPDCTAMVFCTVTVQGQARTMQLPVMDHRNKAIQNPDAFAVNTSMQRALVKAIALHGLGLAVYAGEDVFKDEQPVDDGWAAKAADFAASIETAPTMEAAKATYHLAIAAAKAHDDVKAANIFKATLLARKDTPAAPIPIKRKAPDGPEAA